MMQSVVVHYKNNQFWGNVDIYQHFMTMNMQNKQVNIPQIPQISNDNKNSKEWK